MNDSYSNRQVSLAGAAVGNKKRPPKKKKSSKKRWCLILIPAVVVVALVVALVAHGCNTEGPSLTAREALQYAVTADDLSDKVSYFTLGVLGDKSTDRMDMVAVMCYDRKAKEISVMQMPVTTYIGEDGSFAASVLGDVWGNPKPIRWCDTCRGKVAEDAVDGENHKICGTKLTTRTGSAFADFNRVFNQQFALPTDNYLVIPRDGLAKLIDAVGGVDMTLDADITVDEVTYPKGVRTLPGKAAVYYAVEHSYQNTPASDIERLPRQRQLVASLLDRLSERSLKELYNNDPKLKDVLSNVIQGADPIRFDTSSFGKARLMGSGEAKGEKTKYLEAMARFIHDISRVDLEDITFCTLPGTAVKRGTDNVYSVNKAQTVSLLNEYFNPYGLTVDNTTVAVNELKETPADADTAVITLDQVLVKASAE